MNLRLWLAAFLVSVMMVVIWGCGNDDDPAAGNASDGGVAIDAAFDVGVASDQHVDEDSGVDVDSIVDVDVDSAVDGHVDSDGDIQDEPFWAETHINYTGSGVDSSATLDDCFFCDASDLGTHVMLRYQQGDGWTIWALYIPSDSSIGSQPITNDYSGAYLTLSANDASLPEAAQGFYPATSGSGVVNLTSSDFSSGGVIAGEITATLEKDGVTAHLTATFSAQMN